jgi:predicted exporter
VRARSRIPVILWILFFGACAAIAARARFTTDLSAFLPRLPTPSQRILVDQLREGVVSQLILVGLSAAPPDQLARISGALADRLAAAPEFAYVNNGAADRVEADGRVLFRHRYLLSPGVTPERFTAAGLRAALEEDLDLLGSPLGSLVNRLLPSDPTGEFLRLSELFQLEGGPHKRDGVWFSADDTRALLIVQTTAAGFDLDAQERSLARLHALFEQVAREQAAPGARLIAAGPGVFAVGTRAQIKEDVSRISLLALLLVSALLLVVYRSPRVLLLTLLPVATAATAGIAAVSLAFGSVHGITLGFGATLLGEGVDYAIYLFTNTSTNAAASGPDADAARRRLWRTLRLGVMTSVCGFGVMLFSDFSGLAQLGLFSITGLIVAYTVTRVVLPRLLPADFQPKPLAVLGPALLKLVHATSRLRYAVPVLLVIGAAWLAMRGASVWDDRLESLSPVPEADKQAYAGLQRDLGAPDARYLVVITRPTRQAALETAEEAGRELERMQQANVLSGFESPARILPSDRTQRQRQEALPDGAQLERDLAAATRRLPFRAGSFRPFIEDTAHAKRSVLLERSDLDGTGLGVRLDSLLAQRPDGWNAMLSLRDVHDAVALSAGLNALKAGSAAGGPVHLLDVKQEANELYRGYRGQALMFALIGAGAIVLVLLASLGSPRHGRGIPAHRSSSSHAWVRGTRGSDVRLRITRSWDVLAPLAAALLATAAVLTLGSRQLTMFHLVGMLLVVGVGSNYTLFFERRNFASGDPQRTVTSLALCNASTVIGFGMLALARAPVLSAMGATVALGTFLSLVFAAMLARRDAADLPTARNGLPAQSGAGPRSEPRARDGH